MNVSKILIATTLAAVATAGVARAQSGPAAVNCDAPSLGTGASAPCFVTNKVSATVASVAKLAIDNQQTALVNPVAADFGVGGNGHNVPSAGPVLSVSSNVNYILTASAPDNFTAPAGVTKPKGDLTIAVTPTIAGGAAGSTSAYSAIGAIGTGAATNIDTFALSYGTKYNWTVDKPGAYSLLLTFTLTAP